MDFLEIRKKAKERAAVIESRLSYLTISVPDVSKVEGLRLEGEAVISSG